MVKWELTNLDIGVSFANIMILLRRQQMTPQEITRIRSRLIAINMLIKEIISIMEDIENRRDKICVGETRAIKRE